MAGKTILHLLRVLLGLDCPQTQTTEEERKLLSRYVRGMKTIVEVGVFEGFTTRALAESSDPSAVVYGIDPFFSGRLGIAWGQMIAKHYNSKHMASGKVRLLKTLSTEVGDRIPATVDFVFIDADHSLEAIRADWAFWSNRVRPGGIIALHDTLLPVGRPESAAFGSHRYFRDHISKDARFEIVASVDSLSVLKARD